LPHQPRILGATANARVHTELSHRRPIVVTAG